MRDRCFVGAAAASLAGIGVAITALLSPPLPMARAQSGPETAPEAQVKALYAEKCSACHNLPDPQEKGFTRAQWRQTVNRMLTKYKASDSISPTEAAQIVDYLATFAPKRSAGNGKPADPWATDSEDVWSVTPSATRVFNFEAGGLSGLAPLTAGASGPAPLWRVMPDGQTPDSHVVRVSQSQPSPNRFALLLDRRDGGRNLDVRVRFRIERGQASPSVGIVFGFTTPKSYSVLRYDRAKDDLALIKIAGPAHTALQVTPLTPAAGDSSLASIAPKSLSSGWHTLRLLVRDGQIRGWIDRDKRISTSDSAYTGGKVGLWAQGDTVASFDDWTVDWYDTAAVASPPQSS